MLVFSRNFIYNIWKLCWKVPLTNLALFYAEFVIFKQRCFFVYRIVAEENGGSIRSIEAKERYDYCLGKPKKSYFLSCPDTKSGEGE